MDAHETALSFDNARLRAEVAEAKRAYAELEASAATQLQALEMAQPIVEKYEPCGYYCDEDHGHIDHPVTYAVYHAINEHPRGGALLAELAAARKIVEMMRQWHDAGGEVTGSFPDMLEVYDATRKEHRHD